MDIVLTPMTADREAEFDAMLAEFRAAGEMDVYQGHFVVAWKGYRAFYELLSRMKAGGYPTPDIVPMDSYFIESGGRVLGDLFIRHRLSPRLEKFGGHVGYKVRPTERNRGIATAALRLALEKLAAMGVDQALLTCSETNAASARVIEKCGGVRVEIPRPNMGFTGATGCQHLQDRKSRFLSPLGMTPKISIRQFAGTLQVVLPGQTVVL